MGFLIDITDNLLQRFMTHTVIGISRLIYQYLLDKKAEFRYNFLKIYLDV
jgi:hypothetical protein